MQRMVLWLLVVAVALAAGIPASAQDNLLRDGGFEGAYTNRGRADLNIPADWNLWFTEAPRTESWMNLPPVAFPHNGPSPNPHSGARALNLNKGFATFTAAVYQQVGVPSGVNVTASAWASLKTCNVPPGFDNCGSAVESGAYTRVGIDPNGGTNPYDSDVVWSASATPHDRWDQMTVSATTTGTTATVFLFVTQAWPADLNSVYWDDAVLSTGGTGGSAAPAAPGDPTAVPTPPAEVGFVAQQEAGEDGSLIHIVQPGDTIDSIAVAYGMTRAELLAVNPDITDPRIIQIGQQIVIIPPEGESTAEADAESTGEADEGAAESTGEAETTPDAEATGEAGESTAEAEPLHSAIEDAPPAPIISAASGEVLPAIDLAANDAEVCVLLFEDLNNNRIQEAGEQALADGVISLSSGDSGTAQEQETDGSDDPLCFSDLPAGDYTAAVQPPDGYGLTTPDQLRVRAVSGTSVNVAFGAAQGVQPVTPPPADTLVSDTTADEGEPATTNVDPLADNLGLVVFGIAGVVLVVGLGLSLFLRQR